MLESVQSYQQQKEGCHGPVHVSAIGTLSSEDASQLLVFTPGKVFYLNTASA